MNIPPDLKRITQFIRRAEELERDKTHPETRVVAYYCRQHAVQVGIKLGTSPESRACLGVILNSLEKEKQAMSVFSPEEATLVCRTFAKKIFDKADQTDRGGGSTKGTARVFYASAVFFEILQQFQLGEEKSEEEVEDEQKRIYGKWKATEILKAIKEGREIAPGGFNESKEEEGVVQEEPSLPAVDDLPPPAPLRSPSPVLPTAPSARFSSQRFDQEEEESAVDQGTEISLDPPPPAYPAQEDSMKQIHIHEQNDTDPVIDTSRPPISLPPQKPSAPSKRNMFGFSGMGKKPSSSGSSLSSGGVSKAALDDAIELTRFALKALESKDIDLGATRLKEALDTLSK